MIRLRASAGSSVEIATWPRPPVWATTFYDRVLAWMIAIFVAMCLLVGWVAAVWWSSNPVFRTNIGGVLEPVSFGDGETDADEPLKVESPADPSQDPSVVDVDDSEPSVEMTIDTIVENSDEAARQVAVHSPNDSQDAGKPGKRVGEDRAPLGPNGPDVSPRPPHERWFIRFSDGGSLETYAAQLDHFGIELGLFHNAKIELISNMTNSQVTRETLHSNAGRENQMYFSWAGGGRKRADVKLFREKAGLDARVGIILHMYPRKTVQLLTRVERAAARRAVSKIQRTYFSVVRDGNGFRFVVTRMTFRE